MEQERLLRYIEKIWGSPVSTPKDFQALSDDIFQLVHQTLSPSTLKRLWGYFPAVRQPRKITLDILQSYVSAKSQRVILKGQTFVSLNDYFALFGIFTENHMPWSQPLPDHLGIIIWSPEYNHPEWHNEGDPSLLMPTITEWWTPHDATINPAERNADNYLRAISFRELRITFMKGIHKDKYTFLGVYGLAPESSTQRLVWKRLTDKIDLHDLGQLEGLR